MEVSVWWVLWAFIAGGYAGALVVGLMTMSGHRDGIEERVPPIRTGVPPRGGRLASAGSVGVHTSRFSRA